MALFSKRSGAAPKGFESCEFWFQAAFFNLNTALYFLGLYVCMEENNLKISLALYIRLEFSQEPERKKKQFEYPSIHLFFYIRG